MCKTGWRTSKTKDTFLSLMKDISKEDGVYVLDTETTGLDASKERIIQISAIKYSIEDCEFIENDRLDLFINPGFCISPKITEITGISDETVEGCPDEKTAFYNDILPFFGEHPKCIIAYNTPFDKRFISLMYERYDKVFEPEVEMDVLEMARDLVDPDDTPKNEKTGRPCYKLEVIADLYGVNKDLVHHNSMNDVIATARLLPVFYSEYLEIEKELEEKRIHKEKPTIQSMHFWEGFRGMSRIYINTDKGKFFFDITKKSWNVDKRSFVDIETIDMEYLRQNAYALAGATNDVEFARYRD